MRTREGESNVAERRELRFESLDRVMPEVDRLLEGHVTVGNWSLGQICNHLARTIQIALDPPRRMPWPVRRLVGPLVLRHFLRRGSMPDGFKSPASLIPKPGLDARAEAEALRATIQVFQQSMPEMFDHAFFGKVRKADFARLQCIHCAHHLGFVLPALSPSPSPSPSPTPTT